MEVTESLFTEETEAMLSEEILEIDSEPDLFRELINPGKEDFVRIIDYIPDAVQDPKYSTQDNFTGHVIYEFNDIFLRYGTVMKLKAVSDELAMQGLRLKIWDGFRPVSAQYRLWEICPDSAYVANPNTGYSNHSRGFAVDLTLVDREGRELEMPTEFDDFSPAADRDYSDCTDLAAANAKFLQDIMEKHGFSGYWGEWWHFNDSDKYDVEHCFDPGIISIQNTDADVTLYAAPDDMSSKILVIPKMEPVTFLGRCSGFVLVEYWGYRGYIPEEMLAEE